MERVAADNALAERLGENASRIQRRLDEATVAEQWREFLEEIAAR
jgi:glycosyltransferase involved in cell wall biosynthesis